MANNWIQLPNDSGNTGKQVRANTLSVNVGGSSLALYQHTYTASDPNQDLQGNIFYSGGIGAVYAAIHPNQLPLTISGSVTSTVSFPGTQTVNLSQVSGQTITLGQGTLANSLPVVLPANQLPLAINGAVTSFVTFPALQNVNVTQVSGSALTLGQNTMANSLPVVLPSNQLPLSVSGSVTAFVSSFPGLQSVNLTQVGGSAIALGQTNMAGSIPVVLPNNQIPLAISGGVTSFQGTNPWNENIAQFGGTAVTLGQQVMANSIPVVLPPNQLPLAISGSVTAFSAPTANQSVNLTQVNGSSISLGQTNKANSLPVVLPSDELPLAINGAVTSFISGTPPFNVAQFGGANVSLGQQHMANSIPVVLPDNQLPLSVSGSVTAYVTSVGIENVNLNQVGGAPFALGQTSMANSLPVVIAANELPLSISGSVTATQGVPNTVPNAWPTTLTNAATSVSVNVTSPNPNDGRLTVGTIPRTQGAILTTTQLGANAIYTSQWFDTQLSGTTLVKISAYSDQASATNGFQFQISGDITNAAFTGAPLSISVGASSVGTIIQTTHSRYWRVIYQNGATPTQALEIAINEMTLVTQDVKNSTPVGTEFAQIVRPIPSGTQTVAFASLPLAVNGAVTSFQGTVPWSDNLAQFGGTAVTIGQQNMAQSIPVVLPPNQLPLSISGSVTAFTINPAVSAAVTLGPGSQYVGYIGAMSDTSGISNEGTTITPSVSSVNVNASQSHQIIVPSTASKRVRVLQLAAVCGATATNLTFETTGGNIAISPLFANAANGGEVLPFSPIGWFDTASGDGLQVTTGSGSTTGILFKYILI